MLGRETLVREMLGGELRSRVPNAAEAQSRPARSAASAKPPPV